MTPKAGIYTELIKIAKRSPFKHHKTGALVVDHYNGSQVIATGWSHRALWNGGLYSIHAEIHALERAQYYGITDDCVMYVGCLTEAGNIGLAKPCLTCALAIHATDMSRVWYTSRTEGLTLLELNNHAFKDLKVYKRVP